MSKLVFTRFTCRGLVTTNIYPLVCVIFLLFFSCIFRFSSFISHPSCNCTFTVKGRALSMVLKQNINIRTASQNKLHLSCFSTPPGPDCFFSPLHSLQHSLFLSLLVTLSLAVSFSHPLPLSLSPPFSQKAIYSAFFIQQGF